MSFLLYLFYIFLQLLLTHKAVTFERFWPGGNLVSFLFVLSLRGNLNCFSGWAGEDFCLEGHFILESFLSFLYVECEGMALVATADT